MVFKIQILHKDSCLKKKVFLMLYTFKTFFFSKNKYVGFGV